MFLALKEMRRGAVRFGLLVAAIGLLVFLILTQQALQDGLLTSFVGGIRNQQSPVIVYSVDAQRTLQGSVVPPDLEAAIVGAEGVGEHARIGQSTFTASVDGGDDSDVAIVGSDSATLGVPVELSGGRRPAAAGEAVGSEVDFALGDVVEVIAAEGGDPVALTVVGLARDVQISVSPTLYTDFATYEAAVRAANPDATVVLPSAIVLAPADGVTPDALAESVNAASADADALTRERAAEEAPGVAQVRQSFQVIFLLYALVVPLITGLFFLIITLQKVGALVLLRAVGARSGVLARALLIQVVIVIGAGLLVGIALYAPLSQVQLGSLALRFNVGAVVTWSVLLMVLGLLSALVSVRRVLSIDPIGAASGGVR